jgi:hypothetical protein
MKARWMLAGILLTTALVAAPGIAPAQAGNTTAPQAAAPAATDIVKGDENGTPPLEVSPEMFDAISAWQLGRTQDVMLALQLTKSDPKLIESWLAGAGSGATSRGNEEQALVYEIISRNTGASLSDHVASNAPEAFKAFLGSVPAYESFDEFVRGQLPGLAPEVEKLVASDDAWGNPKGVDDTDPAARLRCSCRVVFSFENGHRFHHTENRPGGEYNVNGAAVSGRFFREVRNGKNTISHDSPGENEYSLIRAQLGCFRSRVRPCGLRCAAKMVVRSEWGARVFADGYVRNNIWSKGTQQQITLGHRSEVRLPIEGVPVADLGVGAAQSFKTTWNIENLVNVVRDVLEFRNNKADAKKEKKDSPGAQALLTALTNGAVDHLIGIIEKEGAEGDSFANARRLYASTDQTAILMQTGYEHSLKMTATYQTRLHGWGTWSLGSTWMNSSFGLTAVVKDTFCENSEAYFAVPPRPAAAWRYASESGPSTTTTLAANIDSWIKFHLVPQGVNVGGLNVAANDQGAY